MVTFCQTPFLIHSLSDWYYKEEFFIYCVWNHGHLVYTMGYNLLYHSPVVLAPFWHFCWWSSLKLMLVFFDMSPSFFCKSSLLFDVIGYSKIILYLPSPDPDLITCHESWPLCWWTVSEARIWMLSELIATGFHCP